MENILEIDSVIKYYDQRQILTDIYLKCVTGDIAGLFGRNGVGKTTLMKIIFGTLCATDKTIKINQKIYDKPYNSYGLVQYLPQDDFLPKNLRVIDVLKHYLNKDKIDTYIEDKVLSKKLNSKIYQLSGGANRYLEIRMLLDSDSKFVLLDEPFNGVAPIIADHIKEIIKDSSATKGIILTDHDYRNVLDVANKYYLLFDGGIRKIMNKNELIDWGYIPEPK